jgi:2-dehydro-3-deoxyphosphogluconate aldolase/(4S)-4-hydroxy-2-oxoglutarate aldolase
VADPSVIEAIGEPGVVAVIRLPRADGVLEACAALRDNGIRAVEITLTIPGAVRLVEQVVRQLGDDLVVGAGTVLDAARCREVVDAGAAFVVLPGFDADVVAECRRLRVVSMPGALTPTEVMTAVRAGADVVKLFPARVATPEYVADLLGPLPGARFLPTGGIDAAGAGEYVRRGAFAVGVGGRLVDPRAVAERDTTAIGAAAREVLEAVAEARAAR